MNAETAMDHLYREVIMEHYREPQNKKPVEGENLIAQGKNPLCGDDVRLALRVEEGVVEDAGFSGEGCALCMASASMLTDMVIDKDIEYAERLISEFSRFIKGERDGMDIEALEDLTAYEGVTRFPVRVKCALLPFLALKEILKTQTRGQDEH
ncbi:MAG: Fe-S cluster assembly sulfur transfer protein SufU [Planctomycetota bacterium]